MTNKSETAELKIIDMGLSDFLGPNETSKSQFGTLCYTAPEVLQGRAYGKEVDLWSLGVIIYFLLQGQLPFDAVDKKEVVRQTINEEPNFSESAWTGISEEAKDVVSGLLRKDRGERLDLEATLKMPWFSEYNQISKARKTAAKSEKCIGKFKAYTLTSTKLKRAIVSNDLEEEVKQA